MRNNNLRSIYEVSKEQSERGRGPGVGDRGNREGTACLGLYCFADIKVCVRKKTK